MLPGDWIAGLFDGEGHFFIRVNNGRWIVVGTTVTLRDDDLPILLELQRQFGGKVYPRKSPRSDNMQARWDLAAKREVRGLADVLDAHPLRTKKARDYAIWRDALRLWEGMHRGLGPIIVPQVAVLAAELVAVRAYPVSRQRQSYITEDVE